MCGIWTYIGIESSLDTLIPMLHRGPDGYGMESFKTCAGLLEMASWRLSILDRSSAGHMPMVYNDRYWMVYNGEVYNYIEIRNALREKGYIFHSDTDTEVIMAAYSEYGVNCMEKFNGMFAFCLWDKLSKQLFIARDRFGVKPLYYFNSRQGLAFASEIKQFLGLPFFFPLMNVQRAHDFLTYGFLDHTDETLFRNIYQIRGGQYSLISLDDWQPGQSLPITNWYSLAIRGPFSGTFEEATEQYKELFTDSVRLRLRSDVPVGSCLSGGMDSSSIVCTVNKLLRPSGSASFQQVFSSCFENKKYDEREFIEQVVSHTNIRPNYVFPSDDDLFNVLDRIVWHQDEPFNSTSIFAQWCVFREARQKGVPVMLDGQGGDEQLGSYPQYFTYHVLDLLYRLKIISAIQESRALKGLHDLHYSVLLKTLMRWFAPKLLYDAIREFSPTGKFKWLNKGFLNFTKYNKSETVDLLWNINRPKNAFELAKLMIGELTIPMLLHWEDRNSMANSVETRVPFLDYRLMEFALSIPEEFKTYKGLTKRVLRSAVSDIVPAKILSRMDKMGFVTPEEAWMKKKLAVPFKEHLMQGASRFPELFNKEELSVQFDDVVHANQPFSHLFWRIISFCTWGRVFNVTV